MPTTPLARLTAVEAALVERLVPRPDRAAWRRVTEVLLLGALLTLAVEVVLGGDGGPSDGLRGRRIGWCAVVTLGAAAAAGFLRVRENSSVEREAESFSTSSLLALHRRAALHEFGPSLVHDGQNILLALRFRLDGLREQAEAAGADFDREQHDGLRASCDGLEALLGRLQELSRDEQAGALRRVALDDLLPRLDEQLRQHAAVRIAGLELDSPRGLSVRADPVLLRQALMILVLRAVRGSGERTPATLRVRPSGAQVELAVESGAPPPREDADDRAFALWAAYAAARASGGTLTCDDHAAGFTARLVLPVV